MMENPEYAAYLSMKFVENLHNPEWRKKNPLQYGATVGSVPISIGSLGLSAAATLMPDNDFVQGVNNAATWVVNPVVDTFGEYVSNRQFGGMSSRKAGTLALGSGLGMMGGQLLGGQLFKDEEGNSNPMAVSIGGLAGDAIGDYVAEKVWQNKPSRDFIKRASLNLAKHLSKII